MDVNAENNQLIYLGGGCFWCIESVFERLNGVQSVISGYMGGETLNPSYREVCNGNTGHAEVVCVHYNADVMSLNQLLDVFFAVHDPTTLNRQGADVGTQYRSVIFYTSEKQGNSILGYIEQLKLAHTYHHPIVTQVEQASTFYEAEECHQDYFKRNPLQSYCRIVVTPKVKKLELNFPSLLK